jgi:hypothetical protein
VGPEVQKAAMLIESGPVGVQVVYGVIDLIGLRLLERGCGRAAFRRTMVRQAKRHAEEKGAGGEAVQVQAGLAAWLVGAGSVRAPPSISAVEVVIWNAGGEVEAMVVEKPP